MLAGSSGRIALNTRTLPSRMDSGSLLMGGSMASMATTCSMWFCTTSRMAPASS